MKNKSSSTLGLQGVVCVGRLIGFRGSFVPCCGSCFVVIFIATRFEKLYHLVSRSSLLPKAHHKCFRFPSQVLYFIYRAVEDVVDYACAAQMTVIEDTTLRILLLRQNLHRSESVRGFGRPLMEAPKAVPRAPCATPRLVLNGRISHTKRASASNELKNVALRLEGLLSQLRLRCHCKLIFC